MRPEIVGVTTEYACIADMLGVKTESEFGLYQETSMGKYYAKFLPGGSFEQKVVRLISQEQAAEMESKLVACIELAEKKFGSVISSAPKIDLERFNSGMANIRMQSKARAEAIGKQLKEDLERGGFHPVYSR